jgi:ornithine decarboxylase
MPDLALEPGRYIAAAAGVLRSQVVLVSWRPREQRRWVYLDIGRFGGLAETEDEAIRYRFATRYDDAGTPVGPAAIAGPSCDSVDVLYQRTRYDLPLELSEGDHIDIYGTGAYTATYSSVGFNGFPPLPTFCIGGPANDL